MNSIPFSKPLLSQYRNGLLSAVFQEDTLYILQFYISHLTLYTVTTQICQSLRIPLPRRRSSIKLVKEEKTNKVLLYDQYVQNFAEASSFKSLSDFVNASEIGKTHDGNSFQFSTGHVENNDNNLIAMKQSTIPPLPNVFTKCYKQLKNTEIILYNHQSQNPKVFDLQKTVIRTAIGDHVAAAFTLYNVYFFDLEL